MWRLSNDVCLGLTCRGVLCCRLMLDQILTSVLFISFFVSKGFRLLGQNCESASWLTMQTKTKPLWWRDRRSARRSDSVVRLYRIFDEAAVPPVSCSAGWTGSQARPWHFRGCRLPRPALLLDAFQSFLEVSPLGRWPRTRKHRKTIKTEASRIVVNRQVIVVSSGLKDAWG